MALHAEAETKLAERQKGKTSSYLSKAVRAQAWSFKSARTQSVAIDRWPQNAQTVSIYPQPVERPLQNYLHKYDTHFKLIVPDFEYQYRTAEQQKLYKGDFSLTVREITKHGAIVQDVVTGMFGFVPKDKLGKAAGRLVPGSLVNGAQCIFMDDSMVQSQIVTYLRMQTGVVFEWDEAAGHGYIMPTEGQDATRMLRVLRRDIAWHGSKRLVPGQFVQFDTCQPNEVPIDPNDEPKAPFALRVHSPEIVFSLEDSYEVVAPGTRWDPDQEEITQPDGLLPLSRAEVIEKRRKFPVMSGRKVLAEKRTHPVLGRFVEEAEAEEVYSPAWLWDPQIDFTQDDVEGPITPYWRVKPKRMKKMWRILTHEVAIARGDTWQEGAAREAKRVATKALMPPGRRAVERMSHKVALKRWEAQQDEVRIRKERAAAVYKEQAVVEQ